MGATKNNPKLQVINKALFDKFDKVFVFPFYRRFVLFLLVQIFVKTLMRKPRVLIPKFETQSPEADYALSAETQRDVIIGDDRNEERTTNSAAALAPRFWQRLDWSLIALILAVKALIFFFGVQSYRVLANKQLENWHDWLDIWNRWDSLRHIRLAQIGYSGAGSDKADIIGFPLFPWLVRFFALVFQDYLLSAFIVSGIASVAAGLLLYKLVRADYSDSIARNSVWFMLIFPTAYFLHINYNESLFLALTVGCFLAARRQRWLLAGILGAFSCATRMNGLVIIPALMAEAFLQYRATRRFQWQWSWILLAPFGFGVYLLVNQFVTGDPLTFLAVGREHFYKSLDLPWKGIVGTYNQMWNPETLNAEMTGAQELAFVLLGLLCTIACGIFLRFSYTVWMFGNWLLFTSSGFILSVPRYTLAMFPIFILFAKLAEKHFWLGVITAWSLLLMALFIGQFVQGRWAF